MFETESVTEQGSDNKSLVLDHLLTIYPLIVIENLCPEDGIFELVDKSSMVLWREKILAGEKRELHTSSSDMSLHLMVVFPYCRSEEKLEIRAQEDDLARNATSGYYTHK